MFSDNVANFALMMQAAGGKRPPPPPQPHPSEQGQHSRRPIHGASPHPAYAGSGFGPNYGHGGASANAQAPMTAQQHFHNPMHASMQSFRNHHQASQRQLHSRPEHHHAAYSHHMHQSQWVHHPNASPNFSTSHDQHHRHHHHHHHQQQQQQQQQGQQQQRRHPTHQQQRQSSPRKTQNRVKNGGGDRGGSGKRNSKPKARKQASKRDDAGSGTLKVPNSLLQLIPPKYRTVHSMGSSPEEIKQWREARRRNYPTAQNVQAKLKTQASLVSAGALSADRTGSHHKPSPDERRAVAASKAEEPSSVELHHIHEATVDSAPHQTELANDVLNSSSAVPASASTEGFASGLSGLLAYSDDDSDDDSDNADGSKGAESTDVTTREQTANAARPSNSVAKEPPARDVDSASSARIENPKDGMKDVEENTARDTLIKPQSSSTKRPSKQKRQRQCDFFLRGACTHGARCRYAHDPDARVNAARKKRIAVLRREKAVREQSLLFQLVKPEISEERDIMLQCIRFLVQNNFLQPAQQAGD